VIARVLAAAHLAVDAGRFEAAGDIGAEQDVVDAQPAVALPAHALVVPIGVHGLVRIERADGIGPSLLQKARVGGTALRLQQGVIVPGLGGIDVPLGRDHVVVARQHDRHAGGVELR
jgi:hypothetical protein